MTEDEIEQRARAIADEAAKQMRKQLGTSTPAELGYPDTSVEELVAAEWTVWYLEEVTGMELTTDLEKATWAEVRAEIALASVTCLITLPISELGAL